MSLTRRTLLKSFLAGAGAVGAYSILNKLPISHADTGSSVDPSKAKFIIISTSERGDPLNANVPGTYEDPGILHSLDPRMAPMPLLLNGKSVVAATPWAQLPQSVLDRTCFMHLATNTPVHPKEQDVLRLMGSVKQTEMLPSILAEFLAPSLGTLQTQPVSLGAISPSESLTFKNRTLASITPLSLKSVFTAPQSSLELQQLRDQSLEKLDTLYRSSASSAQIRYLDLLLDSQHQLRSIDLGNLASKITDNGILSQNLAAIALIKLKISPVISIHIPFGGDNHSDSGLGSETRQTISGVAAIADLMNKLAENGLQDDVLFITLNVFGRTLGPLNTNGLNGRNHNANHQVSILIGEPIAGGVIGGVSPMGSDYGSTNIDSLTGLSDPNGDIGTDEFLGSLGKTTLAAVGVDPNNIDSTILSGKVLHGALSTV